MKLSNKKKLIRIFLCFFFLLPFQVMGAKNLEALSLAEAIDLALKQNFSFKDIKIQQELADLRLTLQKMMTFLPRIDFSANSGVSHTVARMKSSDGSAPIAEDSNAKAHMAESNAVSLTISELSLFNSWKDMDVLEQSKIAHYLGKMSNKDTYIELIFRIIHSYYQLTSSRQILENSDNTLELTTAIYELSGQKEKMGKGQRSDTLFARSEMIKARSAKKTAENDYQQLLLNFNVLIGEPLDQDYQYLSKFKYQPISFKKEELMSQLSAAPGMKRAGLELKNQELSLRSAWKGLMPLPSLTLSGVTLGHKFNEDAYSGTVRQSSSYNSNIDLRAAISVTIPILGDGGFFNQFNIRALELNVERAKIQLQNQRINQERDFLSAYQSIRSLEEQIKDQQDALKNASNLLDLSFKNYSKGKTVRADIKDAIDKSAQASDSLAQSYLDHFKKKMDLAKLLGEENLLGEKFY